MPQIKSGHITAIDYDEDTKTLIVGFLGGISWTYDDVPQKTFDDFMGAESKGKFFAANIRKAFAGTKIVPPVNALAAG